MAMLLVGTLVRATSPIFEGLAAVGLVLVTLSNWKPNGDQDFGALVDKPAIRRRCLDG